MSAGRNTDEELARRFVDGDDDALCSLFDRHDGELRARIARLLSGSVRRRVSISDVIQESRIVALERRGDFEQRGPGAFRRWALGIVEKKALRAVQRHAGVEMRSAAREVTRTHRAETAQFHAGSHSPSQVAIGRETAARIQQAFERLSEDDRELLRLHRDEGLTLRETADRLGRSYVAVRKAYGRALARFAEHFDALSQDADG